MQLKEFLQYIEKSSFQPIECLVTHEVLLEKKLIEHIQKKYPQLSLKTFYGSECEIRDILNELYQTDLFSAQKLIVIKEFQELRWDEDSIASFKKIVSDPNLEHRIVMIISDLKKIPSKVNQLVQSVAHVMEIKTIYPNEMQDYIYYHMQKLGKKIEKSAVDALIEQLGTDLQEFHSQMEKILLYVREKDTIEFKDVVSLVGMTSHHTIFQLVDALMEKNRRRVIQIAGQMLASGQHPLLLLSLIIKQFQQLELYILLKDKGNSPSEMKKLFGLRDFQLNKLDKYSYVFTSKQVERIIGNLKMLDKEIKTRQLPASYLEVVFMKYMMTILQDEKR